MAFQKLQFFPEPFGSPPSRAALDCGRVIAPLIACFAFVERIPVAVSIADHAVEKQAKMLMNQGDVVSLLAASIQAHIHEAV